MMRIDRCSQSRAGRSRTSRAERLCSISAHSGSPVALAASTIVWALAAHAAPPDQATAAAADTQLEEVLVTAQFRQQSLQSTPIAITAVTGQQLDERSVSSVTDLNGVAPNVNITLGA